MREEKKEQEGEKGASSDESKAAKVKASKPLMPTSTILRLLAELVRSYVGIATLIASYSYTAGQSELIKEASTYGRFHQPFKKSFAADLFSCPMLTWFCNLTGLQCSSLCARPLAASHTEFGGQGHSGIGTSLSGQLSSGRHGHRCPGRSGE